MEVFDLDGDHHNLTIEQLDVKSLTMYILDRTSEIEKLETQQEIDALKEYLGNMMSLLENIVKNDIAMIQPMKRMLFERYYYFYPKDYTPD